MQELNRIDKAFVAVIGVLLGAIVLRHGPAIVSLIVSTARGL